MFIHRTPARIVSQLKKYEFWAYNSIECVFCILTCTKNDTSLSPNLSARRKLCQFYSWANSRSSLQEHCHFSVVKRILHFWVVSLFLPGCDIIKFNESNSLHGIDRKVKCCSKINVIVKLKGKIWKLKFSQIKYCFMERCSQCCNWTTREPCANQNLEVPYRCTFWNIWPYEAT
jgi:hypothetical protein